MSPLTNDERSALEFLRDELIERLILIPVEEDLLPVEIQEVIALRCRTRIEFQLFELSFQDLDISLRLSEFRLLTRQASLDVRLELLDFRLEFRVLGRQRRRFFLPIHQLGCLILVRRRILRFLIV